MRKDVVMMNSDMKLDTKDCEGSQLSVRCSLMLEEDYHKLKDEYRRNVCCTGKDFDLNSLQPKVN